MQEFTLSEARAFAVPADSIALWWLGQAGFLIKSGDTIIALDPYLTNSCKDFGAALGFNMDRLVPPPLAPHDLAGIDAYVMTHSHRDHLDPETLAAYREAGGRGPYLAPADTVEKLLSLGVPADEIRMTWPNKEHIVGALSIRATFAIPLGADDLTHVGYKVRSKSGPLCYFSGDTAWHDVLVNGFGEEKPDVLITVINPAFRNLSPAEAAKLAKQLDAKIVIPCHHDLFPDNCQPPQMLRSNLKLEGIGERYRALEHGVPALFSGA